MDIGVKAVVAGVGLFVLGGLSVYLLTGKTAAPVVSQYSAQTQPARLNEVRDQQQLTDPLESADQKDSGSNTEFKAETGSIEVLAEVSDPVADSGPIEPAADTRELTHDVFLAQAEARREQRLIDKAEADRLAKLTAAKERSVECKFWKQQQKLSSATAKVQEKITEHCTMQTHSSSTENSGDIASADTEKEVELNNL